MLLHTINIIIINLKVHKNLYKQTNYILTKFRLENYRLTFTSICTKIAAVKCWIFEISAFLYLHFIILSYSKSDFLN